MKKLWLAAKNDGLFIIDQQPRPSNDDIADIPRVNMIAAFTTNDAETQAIAQQMVDAYNATLPF